MRGKIKTIRMAEKKLLFFAIFLITPLILFNFFSISLSAQEKKDGIITGKIVDENTGDPLIGANVYLKENTGIGSATDLEGNYRITHVPKGTYTLVIAYLSYKTMEITDVTVTGGETTKINAAMKEDIAEGETIVITAARVRNAEAALLSERQRANAVSNAISAEKISKSASSDAADAMKNVTGASIVDGKYVYIRGLGERYSSTQLNGAELPSADPDKKSVQLDIFPANFLENIITVKSFTPDKPGNFTGGSVNIGTKSFPEKFTMSFSTSGSFNELTSTRTNFLTYTGGSKDWIGTDDGSRNIPDLLKDPNFKIPDIGSSFSNTEDAQLLDMVSKAFNSEMAPYQKRVPLNQSYQFAIGDQSNLFGRSLGYLANLTYNRSFSQYKDGTVAKYQQTGIIDEVDNLNPDFILSDDKSTEEARIGGLVNLSYKLFENHEIGINYMYNRIGESTARYMMGTFPRDLSDRARWETRILKYMERDMGTAQFRGKHYFENFFKMKVNWVVSRTQSEQNLPDLRFFSSDFTVLHRQGEDITVYEITPAVSKVPSRYWRNLDENNWDTKIDFEIPFNQWNGLKSSLKFGIAYTELDQTFRERVFEWQQDDIDYDGDALNFFNPDKVGIIEETKLGNYTFYRFGNFIVDVSSDQSNYDGFQKISAGYLMTRLPINEKLNFIGGVRYETTDMDCASLNEKVPPADMHNEDWLPSINFVYSIGKNLNIRSAYSQTLARPMLRELAPFPSFEFVNDYIFTGNPDLKRTLSHNYDLRWEWFPRIGELISVSLFYKDIRNPMEKVNLNINGVTQYQNVDKAQVYGAEFEVRKKLDVLGGFFRRFFVGSNLALIHSQVDIAGDELIYLLASNPDASHKRQLQGQSPYVFNFDLDYQNEKTGTIVSIFYNVFGKRLYEISLGGTTNIFEKPFHLINLNISQNLYKNISLKLAVKNVLNSEVKKVYPFKGTDYYRERHKVGRTLSVGLKYIID